MESLISDRLCAFFRTREEAEKAGLSYLADEPKGWFYLVNQRKHGFTVDLFEEDGYHIGSL